MDLGARSFLAEAVLADADLPARVAGVLWASDPRRAAATGAAGHDALLGWVRQHQQFLAGALQAGSPALFADYARWCAAHQRARRADLANLSLQLELLEDQLSVVTRDQRDLTERTLAAGLAALEEEPDDDAPPDGRQPLRLAYLTAALGGDRTHAWEAVERSRETLSLPEVYQDVLLWSQRQLGRLWLSSQISVAQEHMASAVTQAMLARLHGAIDVPRRKGKAMVTGVQAELHSLPAQFAADLLELDGWDVAFVGTHCPQRSLLSAIDSEKPDALGLSVTMTSHLPQTVQLILAIRKRFSTIPIVLGGSAASRAPELADELPVAPPSTDPREAFRRYAR